MFQKLRKVVVYCIEFLHNFNYYAKTKKFYLSGIIIQYAEGKITQIIQKRALIFEIQNLRKNKPISNKSSFLNLNPFLDSYFILRVGNRLEYSQLMIQNTL